MHSCELLLSNWEGRGQGNWGGEGGRGEGTTILSNVHMHELLESRGREVEVEERGWGGRLY